MSELRLATVTELVVITAAVVASVPGIAVAQPIELGTPNVCQSSHNDALFQAAYDKFVKDIEGSGPPLPAGQYDIVCKAMLAWNDSKQLHGLLEADIRVPQITKIVATRYLSFAAHDSSAWVDLSVAQLRMKQIAGARESALNAIRFAQDANALANGWLALSVVEELANHSNESEKALQSAFAARPQLKQQLRDARNQTMDIFWPAPVAPGTKSNAFSDHPPTSDRVDALEEILRNEK